ncbi:MAG: hypothetical protein ACI4D8_07170 [Wujia sp.]
MELERRTDSIDMFLGLYMLSMYSKEEAENQNSEKKDVNNGIESK